MDDFNDIHIETGDVNEDPGIRPISGFGLMFNKMTSDMKFVGMFSIIYGALCCLTIIGAIGGVPLIFSGMRLREAADEFTFFQRANDNKALGRAFEKQSRFFNIIKILIIVGIVITAIYIVAILAFGIFTFSALSGSESF